MRPWNRALGSPAMVGASLALLLVLGALQWRWTARVAEADLERQRAGIEAAAANLEGELEIELRHLLMSFRPGSIDAAGLASRWDEWRASAVHPDLLGEIHYLAGEGGGLRRVDRARGTLEPAPVPLDMESLPRRRGGMGPVLDPVALAFVMPMGPPGPPGQGPFLILKLDRRVLADVVLAELLERHFGQQPLRAAVIDTAGDVVVARGDPPQPESADVVAPLLAEPLHGRMEGPPWRRGRRGEGVGPSWRLCVAHQAGSLGRAVGQARARNLAVGIAILTVLAFALVQAGVATRRAQALARQQVDFVGAMSHELRTPLTAVRAAGRNLADGVVAGDEAVRRYGVMIETEGRRLSEMVENVMLHARMGSGARAAAPRERVDLRELLSEVATAGPWALSQAPVEIRCDVDEGLPQLQGDRGALRRALVNLVDNAVKHGGARGIAIRARAEPGGVGITVEDRGPGIAPGDEARIFEPFYRASHAGGGAGLGLALVKEVAEAHGGSVRAGRPSGGTGAALTMHLPARGGGEGGR